MDNTANNVLENQVDALAERVARLEGDLAGVRYQHRADRQDAITQARREKLLDRLDQADRSSRRTGRPFTEALDKLPRD